MSASTSLWWVPDSVCQRMATDLDDLFGRWTTTWGLPAAGAVRVRGLGAPVPLGAAVDLLGSPSADWRRALARELFKTAAVESVIVDGAIQRVCDHLRSLLMAWHGGGDANPAPDQARSACPGHWGVQVEVDLLGRPCTLALSQAQLLAGAWLKRPASTPLRAISLEQVLASLPVHLVAELGRTRLSVADLLQLAPGDVLVLDESLDAPLRVGSPGSLLSLCAHLGANLSSTQRAARWVAAS